MKPLATRILCWVPALSLVIVDDNLFGDSFRLDQMVDRPRAPLVRNAAVNMDGDFGIIGQPPG